jgi:hypothetical protein
MKRIKLFEEFLNEKGNVTREFNAAMLYFDFPAMATLHQAIRPEDIYTVESNEGYGLEEEPHCTLLYGLHPEVSVDQVTSKLDGIKFGECKAYNLSLFENDKYDVLKFDMEGDNLHNANKALTELPYTTDYPDYMPHMTVAYLKPGKGSEYLRILNSQEHSLKPLHIVYGMSDGTKQKIDL